MTDQEQAVGSSTATARVRNASGANPFSVDERAAMRVYLQRAEVRLSTMHCVAGAFLSGAGLLFLFPVFLKDAFAGLLSYVAFNAPELLPAIVATLILPIIAFYSLVRDIVNFYFTANHAGLSDVFFHPRFILSGISFSEDESAKART